MTWEEEGLREVYLYRLPGWAGDLLRYMTRTLFDGLLESDELFSGESVRVEQGMQAATLDLLRLREFLTYLGQLRHEVDLNREESRASERAEAVAGLLIEAQKLLANDSQGSR